MVINREPLSFIIKMCLESEKIYAKDQEYLSKIRDDLGLKSRAVALNRIIKKFKELKMELELK